MWKRVVLCVLLTAAAYVALVCFLQVAAPEMEPLLPLRDTVGKVVVVMCESEPRARCSLTDHLQALRANLQYHGTLQADDYFLVRIQEARNAVPTIVSRSFDLGLQLQLLLNKLADNDVAIVVQSDMAAIADLSPFVLALQLTDASLAGVCRDPGGATWKDTGVRQFNGHCFLIKKTPWAVLLAQQLTTQRETEVDVNITEAIKAISSVDSNCDKPREGFERFVPECRHVLIAHRTLHRPRPAPTLWHTATLFAHRLLWATEDHSRFF